MVAFVAWAACVALQLYRVLSISHIYLGLEAGGENFLIEFPNPSNEALKSSFCDTHADQFRYPILLRKCHEEVIPFVHLVDTESGYLPDVAGTAADMAIFVNLNEGTDGLINCRRVTFVVSFSPDVAIGVMFMHSDSLASRQLLTTAVQQRYFTFSAEVNPNMALLVKAVAPELDADFNVDLHYGTLFIHSLEQAAADRGDLFANFKNANSLGANPQGLPVSLYAVFFAVWYGKAKFEAVLAATQTLRLEHPALYRNIPELCRVDSIGNPVAHVMPYTLPGGDAASLAVTPVQLRYVLEISLLEEAFGPLSTFLRGKHVLEIGGGYGGMAVSVQMLYELDRYSIVDLEAAGRLQQRYVREVRAQFPSAGRGGQGPGLVSIPSASTQPVTSDLLISFFAISELRRDVVDRYMSTYVVHAHSGYLQLNYDDPEVSLVVNEDIAKHVGQLYSIFEMFKLVYQLHPTAMLLPPPTFHNHHRIMWKPKVAHAPQQGCADCPSECSGSACCGKYTGTYLQKLGLELLSQVEQR